jgi:hypothetical protein
VIRTLDGDWPGTADNVLRLAAEVVPIVAEESLLTALCAQAATALVARPITTDQSLPRVVSGTELCRLLAAVLRRGVFPTEPQPVLRTLLLTFYSTLLSDTPEAQDLGEMSCAALILCALRGPTPTKEAFRALGETAEDPGDVVKKLLPAVTLATSPRPATLGYALLQHNKTARAYAIANPASIVPLLEVRVDRLTSRYEQLRFLVLLCSSIRLVPAGFTLRYH